ncbi:MAG: hypothetical protein CMJ64_02720 [Planctomycetaceae bacterium]|jgi:hypothetical protein|nr:hypothetical protein [Planctomycetaceae bacterium]
MNSAGTSGRQSASSLERVIVLTQAGDLANTKTTKVQVAVVHEASRLVDAGLLQAQTIRDQVRRHRVFGWYFLPESQQQPEAIVDLRDLHTLPRELLEELIAAGNRVATIQSPYREHLAQHFAVTYSRIALPDPYDTVDDS